MGLTPLLGRMMRRIIPIKYHSPLREAYLALASLKYLGNRVTCPYCNGHFRKFVPYPVPRRPNALCPRCGSAERHRLLWLYLRDKTSFFSDNLNVLDIGPSWCYSKKFRTLPNLNYISCDISSPLAMVLTDITYIPFSDNSFDCIICYHILDQIPDDRQAMRELFRILKPGAGAILQEPIPRNQKETVESLTITFPDEENIDSSGYVFGPGNHVRLYGQDYKDRLEEVGFMVKVDGYVRELPDDLIEKYGLDKNEDVYFCSKPRSKSY